MLFDLNSQPGEYDYDPIAVALLMHYLDLEPARMIFDDEASNQLCEHHDMEMPDFVYQAKHGEAPSMCRRQKPVRYTAARRHAVR